MYYRKELNWRYNEDIFIQFSLNNNVEVNVQKWEVTNFKKQIKENKVIYKFVLMQRFIPLKNVFCSKNIIFSKKKPPIMLAAPKA